jgi:CheY-like chemotaxis protein
VVRAGVRAIVESAPDLRHVGDAASEEELWPLLRVARAHVLVLDVHHPGRDGLTLAARLSALDVTLRVVLQTALRSDELTVAAALAGVAVTVGKDESPPDLLRAIRVASDPGARPERLDLVARGRVLAHVEPPDPADRGDAPRRNAGQRYRRGPAHHAPRRQASHRSDAPPIGPASPGIDAAEVTQHPGAASLARRYGNHVSSWQTGLPRANRRDLPLVIGLAALLPSTARSAAKGTSRRSPSARSP